MKHRTASGKAIYLTGQGAERREFGREWFSVTRHLDGQCTLRAQCEIDAGIIAPRSVLREVIYNTDERYYPVDCYNRLHADGKFLGAGWMRFTEHEAECETLSATHGRYSQRVALERPARSLGSHPLSSDALHLPRFDHARGERIQHQPDVWMTSLEHDGCSGPLLGSLPLDIEYCGRETVTVPAGTFETDHYRFLISSATGAAPREHPTEDVWCTPDDYLFVKATVGGYMDATFLLVEFEPWV
jgi:hypothetical protein